jgi:asparagine synthase (glutamine-hydrolysing)
MSVQFGECHFDGEPVDPKDLDEIRPVLAPYGPDGEGSICKDGLGVLYRAFRTTKESRNEVQPMTSRSGNVFMWDGRLDNREDLAWQLRGELSPSPTDLEIVATAYEKSGTESFARLIGDWALSIWDSKGNSLILAKDFVGTRHLYYSVEKESVRWCTLLEPLVQFAGRTLPLSEEYVAGWFSFFPDAHLTPFVGVHSVPPSSFVLLCRGQHTVTKYWDFDPGKKITYRADDEYEEHFRTVFAEALRRRLRSDGPILAELSGGMDSSSIVCMADKIIGEGGVHLPWLDTVSRYDDSEPNWNERPYFTKVEERRGRAGCHISVGLPQSFPPALKTHQFASTPGSRVRPTDAGRQLADYMTSRGHRVILSGIGGDEATGGVPTPTPELEDLLVRAHFRTLIHQLKLWALNKRKPWFHLLFEAGRGFFPSSIISTNRHKCLVPWLCETFARRHRSALQGYAKRMRIFGPLPSFQDNLSTLDALRRQLACDCLASDLVYEKRYPYLDRSFLEFMYAIPREQHVRPGQRRSLMRRALVGIVPDEVLNRKRKAFVARAAMATISAEWASLNERNPCMISDSLGIIDSRAFCEAIQQAHRGGATHQIVAMMRTLGVELWLRNLNDSNFLRISTSVRCNSQYRSQKTQLETITFVATEVTK